VPQYCDANTDATDCGEFYRVAFVRAALGQLTQSGSTCGRPSSMPRGQIRGTRRLHRVSGRDLVRRGRCTGVHDVPGKQDHGCAGRQQRVRLR
jgi:hypothetical protein